MDGDVKVLHKSIISIGDYRDLVFPGILADKYYPVPLLSQPKRMRPLDSGSLVSGSMPATPWRK